MGRGEGGGGLHMAFEAAFASDSRTNVLARLLAARSELRLAMKVMIAVADCCTSVKSCRHTVSMRHASRAKELLPVSAA